MKKILLAAVVLLGLASCTTTSRTASTIDVNNQLKSDANVDLDVSQKRASFTIEPSKKIRRGGLRNVKAYAVSEALRYNAEADVLVEPQFEVKIRTGLFGNKKIKSVTVTGYPAKYKNFRNNK